MMNEHTLQLLEFARIRSAVADYCLSDEGRSSVLADMPRTIPEEVAELKRAVGLILGGIQERGAPGFSFPSIEKPSLMLAKEGTVLDLEEIYALGIWAQNFRLFVDFIMACGAQVRAGSIAAASALLGTTLEGAPDIAEIVRIVFKILTKDGELRDLPGIREARERIARTNRDIHVLAESYFRDPEIRSMLQSSEPTLRDGRTVLALRANFRGRIKGIVHEVSGTGQTVFIEPADLVEKNNALVEEEARYHAEVRRILRETSAQLQSHAPALESAREVMAVLDGLFARARHARNGGFVHAADREHGFSLKTARHPILGARAVPIDVDLPDDTKTLIITGPNTGGKTVTLKTIGLFALMNQFGLGLPASSETSLAVFDEIFADIGDEQSIDQSLSTFSGHMRVIGGIVKGATARSLVLLDELGSGTDPEEGCAMAMSLLDFFIGTGCLTILTTHHGILKNYGYSRAQCLNASMDFDRTSLSPTYRILMGVPGESRALEIAVKNGLPQEIVDGAGLYLADERADVSELIKSLNDKHRKLEDLEAERRRRVREAMADQRKADLAALRNRRHELELRDRGIGELQRLLSASRKTLENLVREVREGELTTDKTRAVKQFLAEFSEAVAGEETRLEAMKVADLAPASPYSAELPGQTEGAEERGARRDFACSDPVLIGSARRRGVLLRKAKKGYWLVATGSMRLTVAESELAPDNEKAVAAPSYNVELAPRDEGGRTAAAFELNVRGMRLAEALVAVEKQVDAAALQNLQLFSIIHGTGEGVLGRGVQDYLRTNPSVAEYHFARPEEGGYGKTIIRLK